MTDNGEWQIMRCDRHCDMTDNEEWQTIGCDR